MIKRLRLWLRERRRCWRCGHLLIRDHDRDGCTYPGCECRHGREPVTQSMAASIQIDLEQN